MLFRDNPTAMQKTMKKNQARSQLPLTETTRTSIVGITPAAPMQDLDLDHDPN